MNKTHFLALFYVLLPHFGYNTTMIETETTKNTTQEASMVISQRDIDSFQKSLDQELKRRSINGNEPLETTIAEQGMYATVVIPMKIEKTPDSRLMIRRAM